MATKMNCTQGPLEVTWSGNILTNDDPPLWIAMCKVPDSVPEQERNANAHLFAAAPEMLQLLLDQQEVFEPGSTLTYDEAVRAVAALAERRARLLARLREAGVISEEGS